MIFFYNISFLSERGCPAAALRVWPWRTREKTPIELCGDTLDTYKQILSETNVLQLSFYLADKAVGAKGFKATWTEIKVNWAIKEIQKYHWTIAQDVPTCNNPSEFKCRNSSYCISRKLVIFFICLFIFIDLLMFRSVTMYGTAEWMTDQMKLIVIITIKIGIFLSELGDFLHLFFVENSLLWFYFIFVSFLSFVFE